MRAFATAASTRCASKYPPLRMRFVAVAHSYGTQYAWHTVKKGSSMPPLQVLLSACCAFVSQTIIIVNCLIAAPNPEAPVPKGTPDDVPPGFLLPTLPTTAQLPDLPHIAEDTILSLGVARLFALLFGKSTAFITALARRRNHRGATLFFFSISASSFTPCASLSSRFPSSSYCRPPCRAGDQGLVARSVGHAHPPDRLPGRGRVVLCAATHTTNLLIDTLPPA